MKKYQLLFFLFSTPLINAITFDLFSSIADMDELFQDEANMIKNLNEYTEKLQDALEHVQR